ncbi:MAG: hypothetical protein IH880_01155 [Candidatus Marinimicrobia bacterium]|nr:hypothetical protein [Candidatus Neomarinimicrobiota bacterium]
MKLQFVVILILLFATFACGLFGEDTVPVNVVLVDEDNLAGNYFVQWSTGTSTEPLHGNYRAILKIGTDASQNQRAVIDFRISGDYGPEYNCHVIIPANSATGFYTNSGTEYDFTLYMPSIQIPQDSVACFHYNLPTTEHVFFRVEDR